MCTSYVHEDTLLKTRQIKVKKTQYKIINQLTHFINELIYVNFVTTSCFCLLVLYIYYIYYPHKLSIIVYNTLSDLG